MTALLPASSSEQMHISALFPRVRMTTVLLVVLSVVLTACDREAQRVVGTYALEVHHDDVEGLAVSEYDTLILARDGTFLRRHVSVVNGEPHALDPVKGSVTVNGALIHLLSAEGHQVLKRAADGTLQLEPNPRMMVTMMRDQELAAQWTEAKARGLIKPYVRVR